jgi:hypothetical protein
MASMYGSNGRKKQMHTHLYEINFETCPLEQCSAPFFSPSAYPNLSDTWRHTTNCRLTKTGHKTTHGHKYASTFPIRMNLCVCVCVYYELQLRKIRYCLFLIITCEYRLQFLIKIRGTPVAEHCLRRLEDDINENRFWRWEINCSLRRYTMTGFYIRCVETSDSRSQKLCTLVIQWTNQPLE